MRLSSFLFLGSPLLACSPLPEERSIVWRSFDAHVHSSLGSNDTDGTGTPERLQEKMQERDLHYVFLTDHSNSLGSMHCDDVEDCPNQGPEKTTGEWGEQVIIGVEISPRETEDNLSAGTGHIGCLPLGSDFSGIIFTDRPFGEVSGKDAIDQCHDADGFAVLHHPFGPVAWVSFDWTSMDFDALEIYNGGAGFDQSDAKALQFWEEQIQQGNILPPLGSSDSHNWNTAAPGTVLDSALGWAQSTLGLENGDSFSTKQLQSGRLFLGDPSSQLFYEIHNDQKVIYPGESDTLGKQTELHIRFSSTDPNLFLEIRHITMESVETISTQAVSSMEQNLIFPLSATGHYYVRLFPRESSVGVRGFAMGNVISLR